MEDSLEMPRMNEVELGIKINYLNNVEQFAEWVDAHPMFECNFNPIYSVDEWLEHSNYSAKRKMQLLRTLDKPKVSYLVKTFIKKEAYPEIKPPRTINSRDDAFKVLVGPFTHQVEKDVFGSKFSLKGKTLTQQTKIFYDRLRGKRTFISTDYSRWESSVSPTLVDQLEMRFFRKYKNPYTWDFFSWLRSNIIDNNLVSRGSGKVKLNGIRMSGDMHTSLMNTYINMNLTNYICDRLGVTWDGFFEGDDGFIGLDLFVENEDQFAAAFSDIAKDLGFDLKIDISHNIESLPFLSRHYISETVAFREPLKAICHAQWSFSLHTHDPREIIRARGYGLALENQKTPILVSLGNYFLRNAGAGKLFFSDPWFKSYYNLPDVISQVQFSNEIEPEHRVIFQRLFQISVDEQIMVEKYLDEDNLEGAKEVLNCIFLRLKPEWRRNYLLARKYPTCYIHVDTATR